MNLSRRTLLSLPLGALALEAAQIPRPAPPLSWKWFSGEPGDLAKYKGKVIAIEFMISTCPACHRAAKVLDSYYREFKNRGFQAIGLCTDPGAESRAVDFIKATQATFPIGSIDGDLAKAWLQHPAVQIFYVPQTALIDKKNQIRFQHGGGRNNPPNDDIKIREEIELLLKG
jgi:peroxiredoxin